MEGAKLIAVLADSDQDLKTMEGIGNVKGRRLPLGQVPPMAGTSSEMMPISIVTTGATTPVRFPPPRGKEENTDPCSVRL